MIDRIQNDLRQAQMSKDKVKTETLRLLLSEIHNGEIAKGKKFREQDILVVVQREVKKRKEAAQGFRSGGREDQAQKEEAELKLLENYLPAQILNEELTEIVMQVINEIGASRVQDMGKVIGVVMGKVGGRADGGRVSGIVKQQLS